MFREELKLEKELDEKEMEEVIKRIYLFIGMKRMAIASFLNFILIFSIYAFKFMNNLNIDFNDGFIEFVIMNQVLLYILVEVLCENYLKNYLGYIKGNRIISMNNEVDMRLVKRFVIYHTKNKSILPGGIPLPLYLFKAETLDGKRIGIPLYLVPEISKISKIWLSEKTPDEI